MSNEFRIVLCTRLVGITPEEWFGIEVRPAGIRGAKWEALHINDSTPIYPNRAGAKVAIERLRSQNLYTPNWPDTAKRAVDMYKQSKL